MIVPTIASKNYAPTLYDLEQAGFDIFAAPFGEWWNTHIPAHKEELQKKIIHTYYFHQIEGETPDRFRVYINSQLERIMPYYNQLYASELIKFNPLLTSSLITSERSVENLVRLANSDKSSVGKALRDFVNSSRGTGDTKGNVYGTREDHGSTKGSSELDRTGKESGEEIRTEGEKTKRSDITERRVGVTSSENSTENPGKITKTDYGRTTTNEEKGGSTTDENETIKKNGHIAHSDTPQKAIVGEDMEVRLDYLSTYDQTGDNTTRTDKTTVSNNKNDTQTMGGSDTTTESGQTSKELHGQTDTKDDTTFSGNTQRELNGKITKVRDWKEHETGTTSGESTNTGTDEQRTSTTVETTDFTKANESDTTSRADVESTAEKQGKDAGATTRLEGFSGIIVSDLLEAFRKTFLNIDDMIIRDLRENFMEVF